MCRVLGPLKLQNATLLSVGSYFLTSVNTKDYDVHDIRCDCLVPPVLFCYLIGSDSLNDEPYQEKLIPDGETIKYTINYELFNSQIVFNCIGTLFF